MRKQTILRACTSMLLVLSLVLGCSSGLIAHAVEESHKETLNYVSIGDSMTNGYCFTGYAQDSSTNDKYDFLTGKGVYGEDAYPLQFEEYLEELGYAVNHTKLAPSATLAGDLWYVLGGRDLPLDGWGGMFDYVGSNYLKYDTGIPKEDEPNENYKEKYATDELKLYYQDAVKAADIMTLCLGNAEFGAYLLNRITDALGVMGGKLTPDEKVTLQDALDYSGLDAEQQALVQQVYDMLVDELKSYIPDDLWKAYNVQEVCNLLTYTTAGFVFNYKGVLETIMEMNPDAEIILVGLMNTTYGMTVSLDDGDVIPVGDIMDGVFGLLNAYVAGLPAAMQLCGQWEDATFYYTEVNHIEFICQMFSEMRACGWDDSNGLDGTIARTRNIAAFGDIGKLLAEEFFNNENAFNGFIGDDNKALEMVQGYEKAENKTYIADLATGEKNLTNIALAIYLALEDAVAETGDVTDIPVSGLEKIVSDIGSAFAGFDLETAAIDKDDPSNSYTVDALRKNMFNFLMSTDELQGMVKIYALFCVGDGMSVHPTPRTHVEIADAVIEAYESGYTAADKTRDNLIWAAEKLAELVAEYYDDAYAYAYAYAKDAGYIDALKQGIVDVQAQLNALAAELTDVEMTAEFRAQLVAELAEINDIFNAAVALVDAADQLDQDALNAVMNLLNEAQEALEGLSALAAQAADDTVTLVVLPALAKIKTELETNIIPQAKTAIEEIYQAAYAYLTALAEEAGTKLPELYDELVKALTENAEELGEQLGDWAYDYLYNNPDKVIAFFAEYGDDMVDFLVEYQEEILSVVAFLSANYGYEVLEYVLDNADTVLTAIVKWVDANGENAWALIKVYLTELGILDMLPTEEEIRTAIAAVEAIIAQCYEQLEDATEAALAELEQYLPALEAEVAKLREMLESYAELLEDQLSDQLERALAELDAALEVLEEKAAELKAAIEAQVEEQLPIVKAAFEEALRQVKAALEQLKEDAEGAVVSVKEAIAQLYETLKEYQEPVTEAVKATVELLNEALDALEKVLNEHADEIEATILPELLKSVEEIRAELEELEKILRTATDATAEELAAALEETFAQLKASVEELLKTADGQVSQLVAEAIAAFEKLYEDATSADYVISKDSYYVAIGDETLAAENSYADVLAAELNIAYNKIANLTSSAALVQLKNDADMQMQIAKSDLVTLGFSHNTMVDFMFETVSAFNLGETVELDWSVFGYDELGDHVAAALENLKAALEEKLQDQQRAAMLCVAVESYVYAYTTHLMAYPTLAEAIHKINPDTLVILLGMSNTFEDAVLTYNGEEIALGDYVDYLVGAVNIEALAYAMISDNTIYVETPDTQTKLDSEGKSIPNDLISAMMALLNNSTRDLLDPSEEGHEYIKEQILGALRVQYSFLLGDVNLDGVVDIADLSMLNSYIGGYVELNELQQLAADVTQDGTIDISDLSLLNSYIGGYATFPDVQ